MRSREELLEKELVEAITYRRGQEKVEQLLIKDGVNPDTPTTKPALHVAVGVNDLEIVKILLNNKANPEIKWSDYFGDTPLITAAKFGFSSIVIELIKQKVNVNNTNNFGATPLHSAVSSMTLSIVELLLKNGANVNLADEINRTPLGEVLASIVAGTRGANPTIKQLTREQPLYLNIAQILIKYGADIEKVHDSHKNTYVFEYLKLTPGYKSVVEISKNKRVMINLQAPGSNSFFAGARTIPHEILDLIASHTRDPECHTEQEAIQISSRTIG